MKFKVNGTTGEIMASRIMFTAWKACGGPMGMGVFQDRGPNVTEQQVLSNIKSRGDYPCRFENTKSKEYFGDYVFGRMMKMGVSFDGDIVTVKCFNPRPDYNAWANLYPTVPKLVEASAQSFGDGVTVEEVL